MILCDYLKISLATLVMILHLFTVISSVNGITCSDCKDVASPEQCRDIAICGEGEMCFTQEYKDHKGQQAFRLGCTSQQMCTLYINAKTLFGKRGLPDPAPSDTCYQCCSTEECNAALCQGSVGSQPVTSTALPRVSSHASVSICHTQNGMNVCPEMFVPFKYFCYVFLPEVTSSWSTARNECISLGADLISVTSKEENDFLARSLTTFKAHQTVSFWTAGFYSHTAGEFEWVDRSPFNYTNWHPGYPSSTYPQGYKHYILLGNPAYQANFKTATLWVHQTCPNAGVICKKHK